MCIFRFRTILFTLLSVAIELCYAQRPAFRHFTSADGLATNIVHCVFQDSKGYVWFCTESGVNRFDGHRFEKFTLKDGLADNETFACAEDTKGRIWFQSYNGKLSYFKDTGFVNERNDPSLKYEPGRSGFINDLVEDDKGHIWFVTNRGEMFRYNNVKVERFNGTDIEFTSRFIHIIKDTVTQQVREISKLLFGDNVNLYSKKYVTRSFYSAAMSGLPRKEIFRNFSGAEQFKVDKSFLYDIIDGDLWLHNYEKGLTYVKDFISEGFSGDYKLFFDSIAVTKVIKDQEGGLWISTLSEGVYYIGPSSAYTRQIPIRSVTAITSDSVSGEMLVGTHYGKIFLFKGEYYEKTTQLDALNNRINEIELVSPDELLVSHLCLRYYRRKNKEWKKTLDYYCEGGLKDMYVYKREVGLCWLSDLTRIKDNRMDTIAEIARGGFYPDARLVTIARSGKYYWTSSIRNIYRIRLPERSVARFASVQATIKDMACRDEELWVASNEGVFIYKDSLHYKRIFSGNNYIASDICRKLFFDKQGKVWVATDGGVSVYEAGSHKHLFTFTVNDFLPSNDIKDIHVDHRYGYIATSAGITLIDLKKFTPVSDPPLVYIKNLLVGGISYNYLSQPEFSYHKDVITLSYTAITFEAEKGVRYRYMMQGRNESWNETSLDKLEFYNLAPGAYTFLLSAKKFNSDWSKPIAYSFTVLPLWYQSIWFKVAIGALLAVLIYLVFRRQLKRVRKQQEAEMAYHKRIADLEGNALANQMNPHFIFNSLNTVQQFILRKEEKKGLDYLSDFATLIRRILKYSREPRIPVHDEIAFLNQYLELEQVRFNYHFTFEVIVDEEIYEEDIEIPPMLIQPLLENAVKHGLSEDDGHIRLSLRIQNDLLEVIIEDNGRGINAVRLDTLKRKENPSSTALKVVEGRLRLLSNENGVNGSIKLLDKKEMGSSVSGTKVVMYIPY